MRPIESFQFLIMAEASTIILDLVFSVKHPYRNYFGTITKRSHCALRTHVDTQRNIISLTNLIRVEKLKYSHTS